jgi:dihydropteroate synthase
VAREALEQGADVVNVVTGLDVPEALLELVASCGVAIVLNHCRGTPQTTFGESSFTDVVAEVASDLHAARERAISSGIPAERILLDPGLGFGKNVDQNFDLLSQLSKVAPPGTPLVVGASRKAFLGSLFGRPPHDRVPESLAAAAVAARVAATHPLFLRVHDVEETLRFLAALARAGG